MNYSETKTFSTKLNGAPVNSIWFAHLVWIKKFKRIIKFLTSSNPTASFQCYPKDQSTNQSRCSTTCLAVTPDSKFGDSVCQEIFHSHRRIRSFNRHKTDIMGRGRNLHCIIYACDDDKKIESCCCCCGCSSLQKAKIDLARMRLSNVIFSQIECSKCQLSTMWKKLSWRSAGNLIEGHSCKQIKGAIKPCLWIE